MFLLFDPRRHFVMHQQCFSYAKCDDIWNISEIPSTPKIHTHKMHRTILPITVWATYVWRLYFLHIPAHHMGGGFTWMPFYLGLRSNLEVSSSSHSTLYHAKLYYLSFRTRGRDFTVGSWLRHNGWGIGTGWMSRSSSSTVSNFSTSSAYSCRCSKSCRILILSASSDLSKEQHPGEIHTTATAYYAYQYESIREATLLI